MNKEAISIVGSSRKNNLSSISVSKNSCNKVTKNAAKREAEKQEWSIKMAQKFEILRQEIVKEAFDSFSAMLRQRKIRS